MTEKYLKAWKNNLKPSPDNPLEFDWYTRITLYFDNHTFSLTGSVRWSEEMGAYFFQPVSLADSYLFEPYEYHVPVNLYLIIRSKLRDDLGIHITRGIEVSKNTNANSRVSNTLN